MLRPGRVELAVEDPLHDERAAGRRKGVQLAGVRAEQAHGRADEAPVAEPRPGALDARVGRGVAQQRGVRGERARPVQRAPKVSGSS